MTTFISGGHHLADSGAVSPDGKITEFKFCAAFRDMQVADLKEFRPDIKIVVDKDSETLSRYLSRIKTGSGSVVIEFHLNSAVNKIGRPLATGVEVLVADKHTPNSRAMAAELSQAIANSFGLKNRGVKTEKDSARKSLAFVRVPGTVALIELGFINNPHDMEALQDPVLRKIAVRQISKILAKYEDLL